MIACLLRQDWLEGILNFVQTTSKFGLLPYLSLAPRNVRVWKSSAVWTLLELFQEHSLHFYCTPSNVLGRQSTNTAADLLLPYCFFSSCIALFYSVLSLSWALPRWNLVFLRFVNFPLAQLRTNDNILMARRLVRAVLLRVFFCDGTLGVFPGEQGNIPTGCETKYSGVYERNGNAKKSRPCLVCLTSGALHKWCI